MTYHAFRYEDRIEDFPVGQTLKVSPNKVRRNHRTARPRLDRRLGFHVLRLLDFVQEVKIYKTTFF